MAVIKIVLSIFYNCTLETIKATGLLKRVITQRAHGFQFTLNMECNHGLTKVGLNMTQMPILTGVITSFHFVVIKITS